MMSIGAALSAATTLVGSTLPAGLSAIRLTEARPQARTGRETEAEAAPETPGADGALLVAIEAGLREAGYLAS